MVHRVQKVEFSGRCLGVVWWAMSGGGGLMNGWLQFNCLLGGVCVCVCVCCERYVVLCDKLEDSQSCHLVQRSVHWHLAGDSNGSHRNETIFQMQIKLFKYDIWSEENRFLDLFSLANQTQLQSASLFGEISAESRHTIIKESSKTCRTKCLWSNAGSQMIFQTVPIPGTGY